MERLLQPISPQEPVGADARYHEDFIVLRTLILQAESPSGAPVDWQEVATLASTLLIEQYKSLHCACYLVVAWLHTQGVAGLHRGLQLLNGLSTRYPENLFPRKQRGRDRTVAWFVTQLEAWLRDEMSPETILLEVVEETLKVLPEVFQRL
ncbi:MAG: type VI secretion system ImpA family N-terminal domain-containing protein, partial [Nannocystaceae bacterium]